MVTAHKGFQWRPERPNATSFVEQKWGWTGLAVGERAAVGWICRRTPPFNAAGRCSQTLASGQSSSLSMLARTHNHHDNQSSHPIPLVSAGDWAELQLDTRADGGGGQGGKKGKANIWLSYLRSYQVGWAGWGQLSSQRCSVHTCTHMHMQIEGTLVRCAHARLSMSAQHPALNLSSQHVPSVTRFTCSLLQRSTWAWRASSAAPAARASPAALTAAGTARCRCSRYTPSRWAALWWQLPVTLVAAVHSRADSCCMAGSWHVCDMRTLPLLTIAWTQQAPPPIHAANPQASQHAKCVIRVTVVDEQGEVESDGHKVHLLLLCGCLQVWFGLLQLLGLAP